jgi:hypothetical protein
MTFGHDVKCDLCGRTEKVRTSLIYHYVVTDNHIVSSCASPAWCFDCDGIRDSECLPSVERLTELLSELEVNGLDEEVLQDKARFLRIELDLELEYQREMKKRRIALAWRMNRRSPPRCLDCGGTNHRPLKWTDDGCDHPGCNGLFRVFAEYHASQGIYRELNPEGNSLSDSCK